MVDGVIRFFPSASRARHFDSLQKEAHILNNWCLVENGRYDLIHPLSLSAEILKTSILLSGVK
jgi:hypothetical protein